VAKRPKARTRKTGGPFLAAAVFCDNILEEKPSEGKQSGVVSAIRIFDTITVRVPPDMPPTLSPGVRISALIVFRAGDSSGKHSLHVIMNTPDGKRMPAGNKTEVRFRGKGHFGANVKVTIGFEVRVQGVYWFDVILDGSVVTRMPLNVMIEQTASLAGKPGK
jgi:hypothetical protein